MDMNEITKPWGLEVDRVELMLEGVLRDPDGGQSGTLIMPPSVPGLEGLTGPIQQLAMHFLSQTAASHASKGDIYNPFFTYFHLKALRIVFIV